MTSKVLVLDGYVDEPGNLGVPPFVGIYPRYMAGAAISAGAVVDYVTIDDVRSGEVEDAHWDAAALVGGTAVPGKYMAAMPASPRELLQIRAALEERRVPVVLAGPMVEGCKDAPAILYDLLQDGEGKARRMTMEEWNLWAVLGASIVSRSLEKRPSIAEVETYRGCVRYASGGCSFCVEPSKGEPVFREPKDIARETSALGDEGIRHFRLGGQTCIFSYMAQGVGKGDTPEPNPSALDEMLHLVRNSTPMKVLHVDNANPAVISAHPQESRGVAEALVENCTSGNVVALGLESADPVVARENNLNSTPEHTMIAVRLINEVGGERGSSGLPELLPGINFLGGLRGETIETYHLNKVFLENILSSGLLLRRINIRQTNWGPGRRGPAFNRSAFLSFKKYVRENIDHAMLERLLPESTIMTGVYTEMVKGHMVFGRQLGSYPLLVGIPYDADLNVWMDVAITGHGSRSVTGVEYPLDVNMAHIRALESIPGIGRKRATRLFRARPFDNLDSLGAILGDEKVAERARSFLCLDR